MIHGTAPKNQRIEADKINETFKDYIDLAVATRGGKVLTQTDEWFAEAKNLLTAAAPISQPGKFIPTGAWYDGWETRRHNPHYDWAVIQLGYAGTIAGFEIDTAFFTGNHAPFVSVEGVKETSIEKAASRTYEEWATVEWTPILSKVALDPNTRHGFKLEEPTKDFYTHLRFCMYPDGGVARLRAYGTVHMVVPENKHEIYDLASAAAGSVVTEFSDAHYGHPSNMLLPGRGHDMSDGWETKRSRTPGHVDYAKIKLGQPGHVTNIEIDTAHYKGNPPKAVTIAGFEHGSDEPILLLDQVHVGPHRQHFFEVASDLTEKRIATINVIMIPDGGIKRVRIWGAAQLPAVQPVGLPIGVRNELPDEHTWNVKKH
ncbi:Allantoicase [Lobosporangium transversale]|uniref:Galactose-binding domain-like protein n=1 Tax=Lobosporangium transversale TaxID=64571 RepID=A0A1Y2GBB1_9FUNG|nr:galactose-binding domain-like protein [Lobosporangium transversale]KAF9915381.1 Allantoicase [Lobosporangium transversale]ORZ05128.1 galactose-binding domain-like protein [Lobosporangium transversale]|eukprot:XP_021876903.1 galactose-binding domain-like protein [Lobosporangium transversale]